MPRKEALSAEAMDEEQEAATTTSRVSYYVFMLFYVECLRMPI